MYTGIRRRTLMVRHALRQVEDIITAQTHREAVVAEDPGATMTVANTRSTTDPARREEWPGRCRKHERDVRHVHIQPVQSIVSSQQQKHWIHVHVLHKGLWRQH